MPLFWAIMGFVVALVIGIGVGIRITGVRAELEFQTRTRALRASRAKMRGIIDGLQGFTRAVLMAPDLGEQHPLRRRARLCHAAVIDALKEVEPPVVEPLEEIGL